MSPKIKTKEVLIISSDEISKSTLLSPLISSSLTTMIKGSNDNDSILQITHSVNKKNYKFHIHTSNSLTIKDNYVYDAIVPIFYKNSNDSLLFLKEYIHHFHQVAGNKLYPAVFVQYDNSNLNETKEFKQHLLNKLTLNNSFPIIKVDSFDEGSWVKIFNAIIDEIKKENDDAFPYHLVYKEEMKMNKCLKHKKLWNIINYIIYFSILGLSILDLALIFSMPDYLNGESKVDGVYFGIRFTANVVNIIISLLLIKYHWFEINKMSISRKMEVIAIIINLLSLIAEVILHLRIKHLVNSNKNYYAIQIYQGFVILFYFISYIILKFLGVNSIKYKKSKKIINKENYTLQRD